MIRKNLKLLPLLLFSTGAMGVNAQSSVLTSGGNAVGSAGTASYSIGQIDFIAFSNAGGSVVQGLQQPVNTSVLPVTLLNFKATKLESKVLLNWETVTEIYSSKFIVQRSKDGITFSGFKQVSAAGSSFITKKYSAEDLEPLPGLNYYRIQLVDKDGSFIYSKTGTVNFDAKAGFATVYPNPTRHNVLLKIENGSSGLYSYKLFDVKGELLISNSITGNETNIRISKLAAGIYYLKMTDQNNKEIKTFQIIKTN